LSDVCWELGNIVTHELLVTEPPFVSGSAKLTFEFELAKLLAVTGPWAKALKCLESAHITPDIIYFYFLAVVAQLQDEFSKNPYQMRTSTIEGIRAITNSRFDELIEDAPNDTYIIAFFLNPGWFESGKCSSS
jgi:hypothetical protein